MQPDFTSSPTQLAFPELNREQGKIVTAAFDGGDLSSDAGLLPISVVDREVGLSERLCEVMVDKRQSGKVQHKVLELMRARLGAIAMGYPDCNDLNSLRSDLMFRLFAGRKLEDGNLAGQSTLSRWENSLTFCELRRLGRILLKCAVEQLPAGTKTIVIDADSSEDPCHGQQQLQFYNAYYESHCFLPLLVHAAAIDDHGREGRCWPMAVLLRPGNCHGTRFFRPAMSAVIAALRARFPEVKIIVRCDSGFGSDKIMRFCERQKVNFVLGLAQNPVLHHSSGHIQLETCAKYQRFHRIFSPRARRNRGMKTSAPECVHYGGFLHHPPSWKTCRRVVLKSTVKHPGLEQNPELGSHFVATDLMAPSLNAAGETWTAQTLHAFYCRRGDQENRIKEWKLDMQSDRTSCHRFEANQLRVILHTAAMLLLNVLQERLPRQKLGNLQINTLRLQMLKVAARITVSCRRIRIQLPTSFPHSDVWLAFTRNLGPPAPA